MPPWCQAPARSQVARGARFLPQCHSATARITVPGCHGAKVLWHKGASVPRCHVSMVPRCHGATGPRCQGAMLSSCQRAIASWYLFTMAVPGGMVPRCCSARMPWCRGWCQSGCHGATLPGCHGACHSASVPWCAMVLGCQYAMVLWYQCGGMVMVLWCYGASVPWCHGTTVPACHVTKMRWCCLARVPP